MYTTTNLFQSNIRNEITNDFSHVFQPIYSLQSMSKFGYESLIRSKSVSDPELLFTLAKKQNKLYELDMYSCMKSIGLFGEKKETLQTNMKLSVNLFPSTILEPSFLLELEKGMAEMNVSPHNIIFEINEAESVSYLSKMQEIIKSLKKTGFKFALDDLGKGQSSLRLALELEPDVVKLDRFFITGVDKSIKKQKFLQWITSYFKSEGVLLTVEGIENEIEWTIAKQAGVDLGQGYYLGRPLPLI